MSHRYILDAVILHYWVMDVFGKYLFGLIRRGLIFRINFSQRVANIRIAGE